MAFTIFTSFAFTYTHSDIIKRENKAIESKYLLKNVKRPCLHNTFLNMNLASENTNTIATHIIVA
jgi:hypothetical protein